MFSFIRKWFGKSKDDESEEDAEPKPYEKGDPIPHSTEFTGADRIIVKARDCTRENIAAVSQTFVRPEEIKRITSLLEDLSDTGEVQLQTDPCLEHTMTAYKDDIPFAQVRFYDGHLQQQNDLFIGSGDRILEKQAELYEFIKLDVETDSNKL